MRPEQVEQPCAGRCSAAAYKQHREPYRCNDPILSYSVKTNTFLRPAMKKSDRRLVCAIALSVLALSSAQAQTQTTTQRLYLFQPGTDAPLAAQAAENAIASRGRVSKRLGLLPGTLPDRPGEPAMKMVNYGPVSMREVNCEDAYAQIGLASQSGNMLGSSGERFSACVYPSKAGTRIAIVIERSVSGGGIGGAIVGFIRNAVEGDEAEASKKLQAEMLAQVRKTLPNVLVELAELPGGQRTAPDADKVAALLPAQVAAVNPTRQPDAFAPSAPVNPILEARKQLTAMGLTYHSLDAFHDAIAREDALAVELFITAGAVSSNVAGSKGQTANELASKAQDKTIAKLVAANPK